MLERIVCGRGHRGGRGAFGTDVVWQRLDVQRLPDSGLPLSLRQSTHFDMDMLSQSSVQLW